MSTKSVLNQQRLPTPTAAPVAVVETSGTSTLTSSDGTDVAIDGSDDEGSLRVRDPEVTEAIERLTCAVRELTSLILSHL